jgi:hypothetical protein
VLRLIEALYLILKFTITLWQSLDDDIRSARQFSRGRARREQVLTNLEFVLWHDADTAAPENQAPQSCLLLGGRNRQKQIPTHAFSPRLRI